MLLATVQTVDLDRDIVTPQLRRALLVLQGFLQLMPNPTGELRGDAKSVVLVLDLLLDRLDIQVSARTDLLLLATAEEVEVLVSQAADGALNDDPRLTPVVSALTTPQTALEIMVKLPLTNTASAAALHDILDTLKQLGHHQGFVATLKFLTLVADKAGVIAVLEQPAERGGRYRTLGLSPWPSPQAPIIKRLSKLRDAVVARGIQLERESQKGGTIWIDSNRADLPTFVFFANVSVAKRRSAKCASAARLLTHLVGDVSSVST